jgi:predicted RNA-binding Zn-ribbon protein involved in translation (DUF1610 family)
MDEKPSSHVCENCGAKIIYHAYKQMKDSDPGPAMSCPVCGATVPELGGVKVIAFFSRPKAKSV